MPKLEGFTHPVNIITSFLSNHLQKLKMFKSGLQWWTNRLNITICGPAPPTFSTHWALEILIICIYTCAWPTPVQYEHDKWLRWQLESMDKSLWATILLSFFTPLPLSLPHFYFITERDEFLLYAATGSAPQRRQRNIHLWHTYTGYSRTGLWLWWWRKSLCSKYWWWWYELSGMDVIKRVPWYNRAFCMDSWTSCCFLDLSGGSVLLFNRWPSDCLASTT